MNTEIQMGGVRESLLDFLQKTKPFQSILLYIIFTLIIVFKQLIPPIIYEQLDSFLGRLLAIFLVSVVTTEFGWILGLLAAMAVALLLGLPKGASAIREGFGSGGETGLQVVPTNKKWFVERALHENPIAIEEEKVVTQPVQNDSPSGVGGGVQNSSVT
jgi:hypothetical protein